MLWSVKRVSVPNTFSFMEWRLIRSDPGSECRQGLEREKSSAVRLLCSTVFDRVEESF